MCTGIMIAAVGQFMYNHYSPFTAPLEDKVSRGFQVQLLFTLFISLAIKSGITEEDKYNMNAVNIVLIVTQFFAPSIAVYETYISRRKRKAKEKSSSSSSTNATNVSSSKQHDQNSSSSGNRFSMHSDEYARRMHEFEKKRPNILKDEKIKDLADIINKKREVADGKRSIMGACFETACCFLGNKANKKVQPVSSRKPRKPSPEGNSESFLGSRVLKVSNLYLDISLFG